MAKKPKNKKKKGGDKKGKKKGINETKKVKTEQDIIKLAIPKGNDWIILSFCLVPWEAKNITMFLNFEQLIRTNMTIKSLKRIIQDKIGSVARLTFYLNPPKKDQGLDVLKQCENLRLIDMNFNGGNWNNPTRCLLFFDFSPSYPVIDPVIDNGIDPILLSEASEILLKHSEKVKKEAGQLLKSIVNKNKINK